MPYRDTVVAACMGLEELTVPDNNLVFLKQWWVLCITKQISLVGCVGVVTQARCSPPPKGVPILTTAPTPLLVRHRLPHMYWAIQLVQKVKRQ